MVDIKDIRKPPFNQDHDEERSVEDILASIRQMISNEIDVSERLKDRDSPIKYDTLDKVRTVEDTEMYKKDNEEPGSIDVLDLTTEVDEKGNIISASNADNQVPYKKKESKKDEFQIDGRSKPLLTEASESVAADAFAFLASEIKEIKETKAVSGNLQNDSAANPTLEDIVQNILRPMLREWLDKNIEKIVRSLIQREIERISARSSKK